MKGVYHTQYKADAGTAVLPHPSESHHLGFGTVSSRLRSRFQTLEVFLGLVKGWIVWWGKRMDCAFAKWARL